MFNILVSGDGLAWETEHTMTMDATRFKELSGAEADSVSVDRPESLAALEAADTLLLYEKYATGPNVEVVRVARRMTESLTQRVDGALSRCLEIRCLRS